MRGRRAAVVVGFALVGAAGACSTSTPTAPSDAAGGLADGFDAVADAPRDASTARDVLRDAPTAMDVPRDAPTTTDVPRVPMAPADPCDPGAVIDLDRAGVRVGDSDVWYAGSTVGTAEDVGSGPRPACFAWPPHPRFLRWTMRRRGAVRIRMFVPMHVPGGGVIGLGGDWPGSVVWAAASCSAGAAPSSCMVSNDPLIATPILDAGATLWIGVALLPRRSTGPVPVVGDLRVYLRELPDPVLGNACPSGFEGDPCTDRAHCGRGADAQLRCIADGEEYGRCVDGGTCSAGLTCSDGRTCLRARPEVEACAPGDQSAGCLRRRSEGGGCARAAGSSSLCDDGLACNVERGRGLDDLNHERPTFELTRCRAAVGVGETCGADLRRPCAEGLACVASGGVRRCVAGVAPTGRVIGEDCSVGGLSPCRDGLACFNYRCTAPAGGANSPCDRDPDCDPSFFCARQPWSTGTCKPRPDPRERCDAPDSTSACIEGWACGGRGTSSYCGGASGRGCVFGWPPCADGLLCDDGTCGPPPSSVGTRGQRCREGRAERCDDGLVCDPARFVCGAVVPVGSACTGTGAATVVCEPGTYCSSAGGCVLPGAEGGPCGVPSTLEGQRPCNDDLVCGSIGCRPRPPPSGFAECLSDGDCPEDSVCVTQERGCVRRGVAGGVCEPGPVPCRDGSPCVGISTGTSLEPASARCGVPVGGVAEGGSCSETGTVCAAGLVCVTWSPRTCMRPGTLRAPCRTGGATPACDGALVCSWGVCIPPTEPGDACVLVSSSYLCSTGQECALTGLRYRCANEGAPGTSCGESSPCLAGSVCAAGTCVVPEIGRPCPYELRSLVVSTSSPTCGPGNGCVITDTDSTCMPRGVVSGLCRDRQPWCDAGGACVEGVCRAVVSDGSPCADAATCSYASSCEGPPTDRRCRAFGSSGGRCRLTPGSVACDPPLGCGPAGLCE
jgi:hypothetical protein